MATRCASLRRSSCRSRRSKGRPSRLWSGIASWAFPWRGRETLPKAERTTIRAIVLYDPAEHRPLATRFGQDAGVAILCHRSMALWLLGYPDAALADAKQALQEARDIGQATTLMFALFFTSLTQIFCGNYATATKEHDELIALADEKGSLYWKALCTPMQGCLFALTGKASDAVQRITSGIAALRSTGTAFWMPLHVVISWREPMRSLANSMTLGAASAKRLTTIETTKETWFEAEVNRIAGEIALQSPEPDASESASVFRARARRRTPSSKPNPGNSAPP